MIWIIPALVGIFFVFKGVLFGDFPPHGVFEVMMMAFVACVFSIMPILPCVGMAALVGAFFETQPVEIEHLKLVAIRDKDGVTGQFFLGSGMIQSEQYYFYYKTNSDGSVTPDKVRAGQGVRVYEQDRKDAELVTYEWQLIKSWAWIVAIPVNSGGWSYKFYVPKGTVRTGFTM